MDVDKDMILIKKMEKQAMKKKKSGDLAEAGNQSNKLEKKRKKDKRKAENNSEESRKRENGSLCINIDVDKDVARVPDLRGDGNHYDKAMKKMKNGKRKSQVGSETSKTNGADKDGNHQNEKDKKKKKKDKRNPEVGSNKDLVKADDNDQNENHKKKRKRSLEKIGGDQSNVEIYNVERENNSLQVDDCDVSENGNERKDSKKKKRTREEERKFEDDKDREGFDIVEENKISDKLNKKKSEKKNTKKKLVTDESAAVEADMKMQNSNTNVSQKVKKKHKKEKNKGKDILDNEKETSAIESNSDDVKLKKKRQKVTFSDHTDEAAAAEVDMKMQDLDSNVSEKVKKKHKREKNKGEDLMNKEKETSAIENNSNDPKLKKKKKKVTFSEHNEVFHLDGKKVQGKRFTPEEDEMVKKAVLDYIKAHDLGDEGLAMVLNCISHPKIRNCWKEIGEALPYRPYKSVYSRAHTLFERGETGSWNDEDIEILRKYHAEHGPKWKQMADAMGKHRRHVKDAWRRHKFANRNRGNWSQEEYQNLFDLVNVDLRAKVNEEKKSKHGMLRDNISWSAISDRLTTRNFVTCCDKWYNQLTSTMVQEGEWADSDDYRLIDALYALDACCIEDVDWDNLLEHRSGEICRKRWKQMSNHIGENGKKSFSEQVEILSKRYCPDLMEVRETWDNKPVVP